MESILYLLLMAIGPTIILIAAYYFTFNISPIQTLPSFKTLRLRAVLSIEVAAILCVITIVFAEKWFPVYKQWLFNHSLHDAFTYRFMLPFGALFCWIIFVILYEKHHWMRQHPQHSRLIFHHENHIKDIQGISLVSVDGVKAGRGVCLSWINGYYIDADSHALLFEVYTSSKFRQPPIRNILFTKKVTKRFFPGKTYHVRVKRNTIVIEEESYK